VANAPEAVGVRWLGQVRLLLRAVKVRDAQPLARKIHTALTHLGGKAVRIEQFHRARAA
jgi:hypothetical protein